MIHKNDVPDYVKRSAKYRDAQKATGNKKVTKILIISLCAVLLVVALGLAIWLWTGNSVEAPTGDNKPAPSSQSDKFDPSLGVPDATIEALVKVRYERVGGITATFDANVTSYEVTHNVVDNKQDNLSVTCVVESELCKKTFKLDCVYNVVDEAWEMESGQESVIDTVWNTDKLLGWWVGGTTAESYHELLIESIDLENRTASFYNQGRPFENERIYHWPTGELEILPSNDSAPYIVDYHGMVWGENEEMMFPYEEGQVLQ